MTASTGVVRRLTGSTLGASLVVRLGTLPLAATASLANAYLVFRHAGSAVFAATTLFASLIAMLPFADLGIGAAVVNAVARSDARDRLDAVVGRSFRLLLTVMGTVLLLGVLLSLTGAWRSLLGSSVDALGDADLAGLLFTVTFAAAVPLSLGQRVLLGLGRNPLAMSLSTLAPVLAVTISACILGLGAPSWWLVVSTPGGLVVSNLVMLVVGLRAAAVPWGALVSGGTGDRTTGIIDVAWPMLVTQLAAPIALQTHRLILSHRSGIAELTDYSAAMQVYMPVYAALSAALVSLWPAFRSRSAQSDATRSMARLWHNSLIAAAALAAVVALFLWFALPLAVGLLTDHAVDVSPLLLVSTLGLLCVQVVHYPTAMLLTDTNGLKFQARCAVAMAAANVPLSIVLADRIGAAGPLLASALCVLFAMAVPCFLRAREANGMVV